MKEETDEEVTNLSEEKKIGIVLLVKWNKEYWALTPAKIDEVWKGSNEIDKKWEKKVKSVCSYDTHSMGKFDGIGVSEVTDIRDWVAYQEELRRYWNKYVEYLEYYPGIRV